MEKQPADWSDFYSNLFSIQHPFVDLMILNLEENLENPEMCLADFYPVSSPLHVWLIWFYLRDDIS